MTTFNDSARDSDPQALYNHPGEQLASLGLAYLPIIQGETGGSRAPENAVQPFNYGALHERFRGCWMVNNGYGREDANQAISSSTAAARRVTPTTRPCMQPGK